MPVDVRTEIVINQPCAVVAAFALDPDNAPRWYENIKTVEWRSDRPLRVGSRIAFVAHFLGRRIAYTYEVAELSPTRLRMRTADGPFPMETTYELDSVDGSLCRMQLRNRGEPTGFGRIVGFFVAFAMRAANRKDLARLKMLLERAL